MTLKDPVTGEMPDIDNAPDGSSPANISAHRKPSLRSIAVVLASHPPGFIPDPPNVINLSAVAVANEACLDLIATDVADSSVVAINGREIRPERQDGATFSTLRIPLTARELPRAGEYRVNVVTPAPGGGASNVFKLYAEPAPTWGTLERALILGALVAAMFWVFWMINAPLPKQSKAAGTMTSTLTVQTSLQASGSARQTGNPEAISSTPEPERWQLTWVAMLLILAIFTFGVGRALTGTWKSLLIDERNMQSLARLQLVLWTGLVISALATAAAWNIHMGRDDPLALNIPEELWILLGISSATLVGSNLIKTKQANPASQDISREAATQRLNEMSGGGQIGVGELAKNVSRVQARWTDMFMSEGIHNEGTLDVGKIQMFAFTLIVVLAYAAAFARTSYLPDHQDGPRFDFPSIGESLVALLGISSTAYLANKAANQH